MSRRDCCTLLNAAFTPIYLLTYGRAWFAMTFRVDIRQVIGARDLGTLSMKVNRQRLKSLNRRQKRKDPTFSHPSTFLRVYGPLFYTSITTKTNCDDKAQDSQ